MCDECKRIMIKYDDYNYCPYCGAHFSDIDKALRIANVLADFCRNRGGDNKCEDCPFNGCDCKLHTLFKFYYY